MSAGLEASAVTPGRTAPEVSLTRPAIETWASPDDGADTTTTVASNNRDSARPEIVFISAALYHLQRSSTMDDQAPGLPESPSGRRSRQQKRSLGCTYPRTLASAALLLGCVRAGRCLRVGRRPSEHLSAVGEGDGSRVRDVRLVFREEASDGHVLARLQRVPVPSLPHQHGRRAELEIPRLHLAALVFRLDLNSSMWIRPQQLRHLAGHGDCLVPVVLRRG